MYEEEEKAENKEQMLRNEEATPVCQDSHPPIDWPELLARLLSCWGCRVPRCQGARVP